MANSHGDTVSEKYRKYLISIKSNERYLYSLWGLDPTDDKDKILIDSQNGILVFSSMGDLKSYLQTSNFLFDVENTRKWSYEYATDQPYYNYDLDSINDALRFPFFSLTEMRKEAAILMVNFLNLLSDYGFQVKDEETIALCKESNTELFFDFAYNNFFWKKSNTNEVSQNYGDFQSGSFVANYKKMISHFLGKLNFPEN